MNTIGANSDIKPLPASMKKEIDNIKEILRHYGASKIILYGSLARGDFNDASDIDLCYEGIPDASYFRVMADCLMTTTRPVSIIHLKDTHGYFKQRILREGKIIYEQV